MTDNRKALPDHDRPETYPSYEVTARVGLAARGASAVLGLRTTGLDVHFDDEILHYDLEGRLARVARPDVQWRRGLSGRMIMLRRRCEAGRRFERTVFGTPEAEEIIEAANARMRLVHDRFLSRPMCDATAIPQGGAYELMCRTVEAAARFDVPTARKDVASFHAIHDDVPILPPDQYTSLVLLATHGCRYNKCTFCGFYRDVPYRPKTVDEFRSHIDKVARYHGRGLSARRTIFLGQANALTGPRQWREAILKSVGQSFELPSPQLALAGPSWWQGSTGRFAGITSFLDGFAGVHISADEFTVMRQLNLRKIFIGMETGDARLLKWLRKPATPDQIRDTVLAAKAGRLQVGVIVLVGAGGELFFDTHVAETVKLIRAMHLTRGDYIYLSPLVDAAGTEYASLAKADRIPFLSPQRMVEQERLIRAGINTSPTRNGPYVAHYEVENFIY